MEWILQICFPFFPNDTASGLLEGIAGICRIRPAADELNKNQSIRSMNIES